MAESSRLTALIERLPSVYRPELRPGAAPASLFEALLASVANALDDVQRDAGEVLRSRWLAHADRAEFSRLFALSKRLDPKLDPRQFPYLRDLASIAALLPLPPWEQPETLRETAEAFRLRISRNVRLYREGLGTLDAIRAAVEAALPVDLSVPEPQRDRPFLLEDPGPSAMLLPLRSGTMPDFELGPLMRMRTLRRGVGSADPTFYIQALDGGDGLGARNPMVELYRGARPGSFVRVGLAWRGTLAPGESLRLRPAYSTWLATSAGLQRAASLPTEQSPANPSVDGPFAAVTDAPTEPVTALLQTQDRVLWLAVGTGSAGASLWRFDGQLFTRVLTDLPEVRALLQDLPDLLIATTNGLSRMRLHPPEGESPAAAPIAALTGTAVNALLRAADGTLWVGTSQGLRKLGASDALTAFGIGEIAALQTEVFGLAEDSTGTLHVGTQLGWFQYKAEARTWHWYEGAASTEQAPDFRPFDPAAPGAALPAADQPFLPTVYCMHRGPDAALWLGTEAGLARYVARPALAPSGEAVSTGLSFVTTLEAFPDLDTGAVRAIRRDARGQVWFAAARGLFRYDGRDLWQLQDGQWAQLGRADRLYPESRPSQARGTWRFARASHRWQRFDDRAGRWNDFNDPPRSSDSGPVNDLLWCTEVSADQGQWDGSTFADPVAIPSSELVVRYKPDETRIVSGGIPGLPALPVGEATWRWLSMEGDDYTPPTPRPVWTPEGRLLGTSPAALTEAPPPASYDGSTLDPPSEFDRAVFAYPNNAKLWVAWDERRVRSVLVRLLTRGDVFDPAVLDRVWQSMERVRPAGVRTALAVDEQLVRMKDGNHS